MYIALSQPEVPQFRASVKLIPIEKPLMRVKNPYQKPLIHRGNAIWLLAFWAVISLVYVVV